jgi:hypothetical protein
VARELGDHLVAREAGVGGQRGDHDAVSSISTVLARPVSKPVFRDAGLGDAVGAVQVAVLADVDLGGRGGCWRRSRVRG